MKIKHNNTKRDYFAEIWVPRIWAFIFLSIWFTTQMLSIEILTELFADKEVAIAVGEELGNLAKDCESAAREIPDNLVNDESTTLDDKGYTKDRYGIPSYFRQPTQEEIGELVKEWRRKNPFARYRPPGDELMYMWLIKLEKEFEKKRKENKEKKEKENKEKKEKENKEKEKKEKENKGTK